MFQESGYPNLKRVAQVGFLSLASFGSASCFGSPSDFEKQLARERTQEASGQLSTTQSIRHHPINRFIVGLGDKELSAVEQLSNWWKEYSTEVFTIPGNLSDADRRLVLEWYLTTPWLEEGTPALYTETFMSQTFSLIPELKSDSVKKVQVFKADDNDNERYKGQIAAFDSTATTSVPLHKLHFSVQMYTVRMYDTQGAYQDKTLLALGHTNEVEQRWLWVRPCQEYSCTVDNINHSQSIVREIKTRGTMYYGNTQGGQERARKIEQMQNDRAVQVASLLINGNITAEKAREATNANSQVQVEPFDNRNIIRQENPSADNYPPCDNINFDMRPVGNGVLGVGERYGSFKGKKVICRKIN